MQAALGLPGAKAALLPLGAKHVQQAQRAAGRQLTGWELSPATAAACTASLLCSQPGSEQSAVLAGHALELLQVVLRRGTRHSRRAGPACRVHGQRAHLCCNARDQRPGAAPSLSLVKSMACRRLRGLGGPVHTGPVNGSRSHAPGSMPEPDGDALPVLVEAALLCCYWSSQVLCACWGMALAQLHCRCAGWGMSTSVSCGRRPTRAGTGLTRPMCEPGLALQADVVQAAEAALDIAEAAVDQLGGPSPPWEPAARTPAPATARPSVHPPRLAVQPLTWPCQCQARAQTPCARLLPAQPMGCWPSCAGRTCRRPRCAATTSSWRWLACQTWPRAPHRLPAKPASTGLVPVTRMPCQAPVASCAMGRTAGCGVPRCKPSRLWGAQPTKPRGFHLAASASIAVHAWLCAATARWPGIPMLLTRWLRGRWKSWRPPHPGSWGHHQLVVPSHAGR